MKQATFTNRELEILQLICKGYTNLEIANTLNISYHTVKNHVASILLKLGVKNRLLAAMEYAKCIKNN